MYSSALKAPLLAKMYSSLAQPTNACDELVTISDLGANLEVELILSQTTQQSLHVP